VTDTTLDRYVSVTGSTYEELVHPEMPGNGTDRADACGDYCLFVQGYFYSHPLPQEEFLAFIAKQDFHTQRKKALEIV
jgi:hypothetical protein